MHVPDMWFPRRKAMQSRVDRTLIQVEIVVDEDPTNHQRIPRLLITDLLVFEGHFMAKHPISHRLQCAKVELIEPMQKY